MSIEKFSGQFKNEANGVTVLINETINGLDDLEALGLYVFLSTKPDTWKIHYRHIMRTFKIGKNKAYKLLNILLDKGLLTKEIIKEKGRFVEHCYMLHLRPDCTSAPVPRLSEVVEPELVNGETYKTKNKENKECSGADRTTTTDFDIFSLFRDRGIPTPKSTNSYVDGIVENAQEKLSSYGFSLKSYLDYLVNECGHWVFEPHNDRVNDFFVILRPLNIEKGCNGKFEDRICR